MRERVGIIFTAGGRTHRRARIKRYDTPRWPDVRLQTFFVVQKRSTHGHHTTTHTCRILWCSVLFCFGGKGYADKRKGTGRDSGRHKERETACGRREREREYVWGRGGGRGPTSPNQTSRTLKSAVRRLESPTSSSKVNQCFRATYIHVFAS